MPTTSPLILVVENDKIWRGNLVKMLEDMGYKVTTADSGFTAQERLLNTKNIDVVISSILLPDLTGPDLLIWERKNFRSRPRHRVFVFISGITNTKESQKAKELGAEIFLTRPIDADFLKQAMDKVSSKL